jgi:hypothetical protein
MRPKSNGASVTAEYAGRTCECPLWGRRALRNSGGSNIEHEKSSKNAAYVDAVARTSVLLGLDNIRRRSPVWRIWRRRAPFRSWVRCTI